MAMDKSSLKRDGPRSGPVRRLLRVPGVRGLNVRRLQALVALHDLELDLLALGQRPVALRLDGGVMHEDIVAVLPGDEAEALLVREPLHGALSQLLFLLDANDGP